MTSGTAIQVEHIWKEYQFGTVSHRSLVRDLQSWWARLRGLPDPNTTVDCSSPSSPQAPQGQDRFWALQDISFTVEEGSLLAIIGRNGAGKSTLLKILSRVTAPTRGTIAYRGRLASLLEVGTGFHPELTGRENIFLNGAILGMGKAEIKRKFDEIVAFSEIERFIDTPVKRYSSGMYVRLAFGVAAHLEPEILIIDEVLAVGDIQFQRKCLGKMESVGRGGRTVLFVSHNLAAMENLCQTGVVMIGGRIALEGAIADAVNFYLNSIVTTTETSIDARLDRSGKGDTRVTGISIQNSEGQEGVPVQIGSEVKIQIDYHGTSCLKNIQVIIGVYDLMGTGVTRFDTAIAENNLPAVLPESGRIVCMTDRMSLVPGRYFINIALLANGTMQDYMSGATILDIVGSDFFGTGKMFSEADSSLAKLLIRHRWSLAS